MRIDYILAIAAFAVLFTSGCDSADVRDTISVVRSVPDTTVHVGAEFIIDLHDHFLHGSNGELSFILHVNGSAARLIIHGSELRVAAEKPGTSTVTVTAIGQAAEALDMRFVLHVVCPTELSDQEASYFPNELGQEWTYDYREYSGSLESQYQYTTTGTLSWRVSRREDRCSEIVFEIAESFEGRLEQNFIGNEDSTFAVAWEKILSARLARNRLVIEEYTDDSHSALNPVQWIFDESAPNVVRRDSTIFCGFGGCTRVGLDLEREVGITRWLYLSIHRSSDTKSLTLRQ